MPLILSGVDPNKCGFKVDNLTFKTMKEFLTRPMSTARADTYYVPIQKMIPPGFEFDLLGAKEFFEWYRNYDLKNLGNLRQLRRIYHGLPYPYAQVLDKVYIKCGLHIHEKTAQRT